MAEPDDYLTRVAREERERKLAEDRQRRADMLADARRRRDRVYEANKHMSTLCAVAVGLVFSLGRLGVAEVDLILGMFAFGVPLIESLSGLVVAAVVPEKLDKDQADLATTVAGGVFVVASSQFTLGALFLLILPSATGTLGG